MVCAVVAMVATVKGRVGRGPFPIAGMTARVGMGEEVHSPKPE